MIRLSIIVPFYNVEKYIEQCIRSLYDQDIPWEEYEVICVDDCSPDGSRAIVERLQKEYPTLKLLTHEVNKKLGAARNTGRRFAKGKYIWNVDSDDAIEKNCLSQLLTVCEQDNLDVLMFGYNKWDGLMKQGVGNNLQSLKSVKSGLEYMVQLNPHSISYLCPVWNKIIKKEFLDCENIYSPEINMGEDVPYSFRVVSRAGAFCVIADSCYLYRLNPISLTGKDTIPKATMLYEKCMNNSRMIVEVAAEIPERYASVRDAILSVASYTLQTMMPLYEKMTIEDKKIFKSFLKQGFFSNSHVFKLLKAKKSFNYLFWLFCKKE